jgi:superfamily I DNA and/or RNA helicase
MLDHRLYEIEFDKLRASGKFSENQLSRVRLHTLDSSQGDEEDIVIADLAQTDAPGFTGDLHRICLMLTRPVISQIILMDKGMWLVVPVHPVCREEQN